MGRLRSKLDQLEEDTYMYCIDIRLLNKMKAVTNEPHGKFLPTIRK